MKTILNKTKKIIPLLTVLLVLATSCRSDESITSPDNNSILETNSKLANLLKRVSLNDGSDDNIIDFANCLDIELPITVMANGTPITINTEDDFDTVETIFNASDTDTDTLVINFPITVLLTDYSDVVVNNQDQLNGLAASCNGENEDDDDIECVDFLYPISAIVFNTITEQTNTITINNDNQLNRFIEDLSVDDVARINFPVTLILFDNSQMTANSLSELETIIDTIKDDCDEDDDFDFNDDCNGCTTTQVTDLITTCANWFVDKLERNNNDLEDLYTGFTFNFATDGTISVQDDATNHSGTWSVSGSGNNLRFMIVIATLPDFNGSWFVHEIEEEPGETKIDFRLGNQRLRFESTCN